MFYSVAVILQHVVNGNHYQEHVQEEVGFRGSWTPGCRGSHCARSVEGQLRLSSGTSEGLLGSWAEANLSKQCGQNEAERRKAGGELALKERECLAQGLTVF